ncbi:hypothetical protein MIR68_002563 [Amoeboaphelidium protococcarum]|nr:hypothetical protein MIR68_002563 [Amoeboaphelidium protococcarum]
MAKQLTRYDKYGFVQDDYGAQHEGQYQQILSERKQRWIEWLDELNNCKLFGDCLSIFKIDEQAFKYPARCSKLNRFIRKGIPSSLRPVMWLHYSGAMDKMNCYLGLYGQLVGRVPNEINADVIRVVKYELDHTFKDNVNFNPQQSHTPTALFQSPGTASSSISGVKSQSSLSKQQLHVTIKEKIKNIILALLVHNKGLNKQHPPKPLYQITSLIFLILSNQKTMQFNVEEATFWLMETLLNDILPTNMFTEGYRGAKVDQDILWEHMLPQHGLGKTTLKRMINDYYDNDVPPLSTITIQWFMNLYVGILPIETVLRIWDCLICNGREKQGKVLFTTALSLIKMHEGQICQLQDVYQTTQFFLKAPKYVHDCHAFMQYAHDHCDQLTLSFGGSGPGGYLSSRNIHQLRIRLGGGRCNENPDSLGAAGIRFWLQKCDLLPSMSKLNSVPKLKDAPRQRRPSKNKSTAGVNTSRSAEKKQCIETSNNNNNNIIKDIQSPSRNYVNLSAALKLKSPRDADLMSRPSVSTHNSGEY